MFKTPPVIVGLEVGTSKVVAMVGDVGANGALNIIGVGQSRSRGVRKGEIADASMVEEDIRNAIVEAEQMADVEIRSVFLGVTGTHVRGLNNRGVQQVLSVDREITPEDVQDVIKNAKAINLPADHQVVHAIRQHFIVDGQDEIRDPVGMLGTRLELDMHVLHGKLHRLQNPIRVVKGLQLEVDDIVFNGLASSLTVLNNDAKELGALVIDLGGGTTDYVLYGGGIIKHSGVLAVGGDHVSNDLAYGLKVPLGRAEQLKLEHGAALVDASAKGQTIALTSDLGLPEKSVNLEHLRKIMSLRLQEIFELIAGDLEQAGVLGALGAGVFICGGGARIHQVQRLAEQIFETPAYLTKACSISGLKSALDQPEFATAIGLVKYGSFHHQQKRTNASRLTQGLKQTLTTIFKRG